MNTNAATERKPWDRLARFWQHCLDLGLVLWILRVPVCAVLFGLLLLGYTSQAQDLFVEFAGQYGRAALFLFLLTVVWAGTTHYAARLLLDTDTRFRQYAARAASSYLFKLERWIPRLLGTAPFVIVLIAAERSLMNLPDIQDPGVINAVRSNLRVLQAVVALVGIGFFAYTVGRRSMSAGGLVQRAEARTGIVNRFLQRIGLGGSSSPGERDIRPGLGPLLLILVFLISAGVIVLGADHVAQWLPRALVVPIILGGWLPLLTFLSGLGRQLRAPLIFGAVLTIAILSVFLGDNHSVRRIDAAAILKKPVATATITLNQALDLWMKENGCAGAPGSCPRPILIVGSGGASRAGFFTASIIGELLDQARQHVSTRGDRLNETKMRNRIFAISAVSGSAVAAAMTVAALARGGPETRNPCRERKPPLWYGAKVQNWRDCLEALMAGDFLTPTVIGLIFHDSIRFGWWRDRAALLERSWELRFAEVTGGRNPGHWQDQCPGDMRCPFVTMRPHEGLWLPLLLLNGTSAATGQRLLTMMLDPVYTPAARCPTAASSLAVSEIKMKSLTSQTYVTENHGPGCPIFMEATRFHTLLTNDTDVDFWAGLQRLFVWEYVREKLSFLFAKQNLDDIRLSTAAHNSARFPIISPPGAVRNLRHNIVDRIVDGGYVENYGALTAMELAVAIRAAQPGLSPFVLVISNDPDENPDLNRLEVPDSVLLTDVSIPIQAIANTRTGRGRLAVQQLNSVLDILTRSSCGDDTAHVRVWPQYRTEADGSEEKTSRPVSMSWWLSTPVQIHLHQQTEGTKNQNQNGGELAKVWRAIESASACATSGPTLR
ncbi:MAG TPA: hypothetical protein VFP60_02575 [Pseudolabrys sp.]|nr:hypothetical protein [Pseudolabrys sp.]